MKKDMELEGDLLGGRASIGVGGRERTTWTGVGWGCMGNYESIL